MSRWTKYPKKRVIYFLQIKECVSDGWFFYLKFQIHSKLHLVAGLDRGSAHATIWGPDRGSSIWPPVQIEVAHQACQGVGGTLVWPGQLVASSPGQQDRAEGRRWSLESREQRRTVITKPNYGLNTNNQLYEKKKYLLATSQTMWKNRASTGLHYCSYIKHNHF